MHESNQHIMIRLLFFLIILTGLFSCESQVQNEELIPGFTKDHLRTHTKCDYQYEGNRLAKTYETLHVYLDGRVAESYGIITDYEYFESGLLAKEKMYFESGKIISTRFFKYNSVDSIVEQMSTDSENDTTFWEKYSYFPDGKRVTFRSVMGTESLFDDADITDPNSGILIASIYERYEYIYDEDRCLKQITYLKDGNANKYIDFEYDDNGKLMKEIHTQIFDGMELPEKTKYYDYSKSLEFPDFYALNPENYEIEQLHNEFKGEGVMIETRFFDYGNSITQTTYVNGKKVRGLDIAKNSFSSYYYEIVYNERGDIVERFTFWKE